MLRFQEAGPGIILRPVLVRGLLSQHHCRFGARARAVATGFCTAIQDHEAFGIKPRCSNSRNKLTQVWQADNEEKIEKSRRLNVTYQCPTARSKDRVSLSPP
jgi:hypothetical protein